MELTVYNQEGKKTSSVKVPESIFKLPMNEALVHQVYTVKLSRQRRNYAHTKTRADVRGGGIKPWRQKGTGRARHGSIRSPLWRSGGVTFGPRNERVYAKNINKKMNKKALAVVLSAKVADSAIYIVDSLSYKEPKTKFSIPLLNVVAGGSQSTLILGVSDDKNFRRVFNNVPYANPISINRINIIDILNNKNCVFSKESLNFLINSYANTIQHIQKDRNQAHVAERKSVERKKASRLSQEGESGRAKTAKRPKPAKRVSKKSS